MYNELAALYRFAKREQWRGVVQQVSTAIQHKGLSGWRQTVFDLVSEGRQRERRLVRLARINLAILFVASTVCLLAVSGPGIIPWTNFEGSLLFSAMFIAPLLAVSEILFWSADLRTALYIGWQNVRRDHCLTPRTIEDFGGHRFRQDFTRLLSVVVAVLVIGALMTPPPLVILGIVSPTYLYDDPGFFRWFPFVVPITVVVIVFPVFQTVRRMPQWEGPPRMERRFSGGQWIWVRLGRPPSGPSVVREGDSGSGPLTSKYVPVFNPNRGAYELTQTVTGDPSHPKPEVPDHQAPSDTHGSSSEMTDAQAVAAGYTSDRLPMPPMPPEPG
jgi:hypothetical protein